ncbi:hypothetical protein FB451DRAFT_730897 [Mycena latifolia]|nr:hypothetical protein FB451DRAFT_730897 [Mycena latifolia]
MPRAQGGPANAQGGVRLRLAAGSPLCALLRTKSVPPSLTAKVAVRGTVPGASWAPSRRLGAREETPESALSRGFCARVAGVPPLGHRAPSPPLRARTHARRERPKRRRARARAHVPPNSACRAHRDGPRMRGAVRVCGLRRGARSTFCYAPSPPRLR